MCRLFDFSSTVLLFIAPASSHLSPLLACSITAPMSAGAAAVITMGWVSIAELSIR